MNSRFSNLAVFILGGAFLTLPINQMKAEASQSYIKSETQQINKIVNHYSENQQQLQQESHNPTLISQNYVEKFKRETNRIMTQPSPYVEKFKRETNRIMTQPSPYVEKFRQQTRNQFPLYQQQQPFSPVSPSSQGFQDINNLFKRQTNEIVNRDRQQNSRNRVLNSFPNINQSNIEMYQRLGDTVKFNWVAPK